MKAIISIILALSFLSDALLINEHVFGMTDVIEWMDIDIEKDSNEKKTEVEDKILADSNFNINQSYSLLDLQPTSWLNDHSSSLLREILTPPPELS